MRRDRGFWYSPPTGRTPSRIDTSVMLTSRPIDRHVYTLRSRDRVTPLPLPKTMPLGVWVNVSWTITESAVITSWYIREQPIPPVRPVAGGIGPQYRQRQLARKRRARR